MKIVFSSCYMDEKDAKTFLRRIQSNYEGLKFKVNLNLASNAFEKVVESITAEGNGRDIDVFIKRELQHTNYMIISR